MVASGSRTRSVLHRSHSFSLGSDVARRQAEEALIRSQFRATHAIDFTKTLVITDMTKTLAYQKHDVDAFPHQTRDALVSLLRNGATVVVVTSDSREITEDFLIRKFGEFMRFKSKFYVLCGCGSEVIHYDALIKKETKDYPLVGRSLSSEPPIFLDKRTNFLDHVLRCLDTSISLSARDTLLSGTGTRLVIQHPLYSETRIEIRPSKMSIFFVKSNDSGVRNCINHIKEYPIPPGFSSHDEPNYFEITQFNKETGIRLFLAQYRDLFLGKKHIIMMGDSENDEGLFKSQYDIKALYDHSHLPRPDFHKFFFGKSRSLGDFYTGSLNPQLSKSRSLLIPRETEGAKMVLGSLSHRPSALPSRTYHALYPARSSPSTLRFYKQPIVWT